MSTAPDLRRDDTEHLLAVLDKIAPSAPIVLGGDFNPITASREERENREAVKRSCGGWGIEQPQAAMLGNEDVGGSCVVTPRATQATGVPRVQDLELADRDPEYTRDRPVCAVLLDQASAEQEVRVIDPAAERPLARYPVAPVDPSSHSAWCPYAGSDPIGTAEYLVKPVRREPARQEAARSGDRHAPLPSWLACR